MGLSNKNSVVAVMIESTEGVPVPPGAGTDFIAQQDGFSIDPNFNRLTNNEIRASIGHAKTFLGIESPTAQISHYLRHSGTEGQAPNYNKFLKALFGSEFVTVTERQTVASSTVSDIKVGSGLGVNFQRGLPVLVKDPTNGFSIRAIHSVSGDDLTPGFDLPGAPATGVKLGKGIAYIPVNTGHPTITISEYRGNPGFVEMLAGGRVTDATIDLNAGEFINAQYTIDGVAYYLNPLNVISSRSKLDFLDNSTTRFVSIALGFYKDPNDLASAIATAMNALGSANTFSVSYDPASGKFTFTSTGSTLSLLWSTGANAANSIGLLIGADVSADQTSALTYTLANAINVGAPFTPSYDNADPLVAKNNELFIGDDTSLTLIKGSKVQLKFTDTRFEIKDVTSSSGVSGSVINDRAVTVSVTAVIDKYDVDKFTRFRTGSDTRFQYNFGTKSGGNWVPGKCGCLYIPTATVTKFKLNNDTGLVIVELELTAFVDANGNGEAYLGFV